MITDASAVLSHAGSALGAGGVYYKHVSIVIPQHWDPSYCRVKIVNPSRGVAYQVIIVRYCKFLQLPEFGLLIDIAHIEKRVVACVV